MMPKAIAASAVIQRSRWTAVVTSVTPRPTCRARITFTSFSLCRMFSAATLMSAVVPRKPAEALWIMSREFGVANLRPGSPAASSHAAILKAGPMQNVEIGALTSGKLHRVVDR